MWLLDASTLELRDFVGAGIPPYAILSHTWGEDEVSFREMRKYREAIKEKAGYAKILKCCEKARSDGHHYLWIDTCCIDKRSSAELSEAINSMWKWYQKSEICYAYLADVPSRQSSSTSAIDYDALSKSRWFTRGWTLQELIAPFQVQFLDQDWCLIGRKTLCGILPKEPPFTRKEYWTFLSKIAEITGVDVNVLSNPLDSLTQVAAAKKMFWASKRVATREEDLAYSLMGLFGVSMPILYGEGLIKAFRRLQLEIIQTTTDQSIFGLRLEIIKFNASNYA
ncbi:HET-domain-containing protein [Stipitochalara longipes BDJ]|nr:HET-domain-containing protein [Stipitochalara longipes BDJ]